MTIDLGADAAHALLTDGDWWTAVANSVLFAALNTAGSVLVGVACAVLLTRTNIPGRRVLTTLLLIPIALPGLVLIIGWAAMWTPAGFASSWLSRPSWSVSAAAKRSRAFSAIFWLRASPPAHALRASVDEAKANAML